MNLKLSNVLKVRRSGKCELPKICWSQELALSCEKSENFYNRKQTDKQPSPHRFNIHLSYFESNFKYCLQM